MPTPNRSLILLMFLISTAPRLSGQEPVCFSGSTQVLTHWHNVQSADTCKWRDSETIRQAPVVNMEKTGSTRGYHIIQCQVILDSSVVDEALMFDIQYAGSAATIYWDNRLLGQNGIPGATRSSEQPGKHRFQTVIPVSRLSPGAHDIQIHFSDWYKSRHFYTFTAAIKSQRHFYNTTNEEKQQNAFLNGILITLMLLSLVLWSGNKSRAEFLMLAILSFSYVVVNVFNVQNTFGIAAAWADAFHLTQAVLWYLAYVGHLIFMALVLSRRCIRSIIWTGAAVFIIEFIWGGSLPVLPFHLYYAGWLCIIFVGSFRQHKKDSAILLTGSTIRLLTMASPWLMPDISLALYQLLDAYTSIFMLFCFLTVIGRQMVQRELERRHALVKAQRLENEMLKKAIQPHFMMNTLLSVVHLITRNPAKAVELIHLLSEELRLINTFSRHQLISLQEELALCGKHLSLMGIRHKAEYRLDINCDNQSLMLPPMILHTLIENGLTHAMAPSEAGEFRLTTESTSVGTSIVFENNGSKLAGASDPRSLTQDEAGLGLRYVRARLEESFPGQWQLRTACRNGWWQVMIDLQEMN